MGKFLNIISNETLHLWRVVAAADFYLGNHRRIRTEKIEFRRCCVRLEREIPSMEEHLSLYPTFTASGGLEYGSDLTSALQKEFVKMRNPIHFPLSLHLPVLE